MNPDNEQRAHAYRECLSIVCGKEAIRLKGVCWLLAPRGVPMTHADMALKYALAAIKTKRKNESQVTKPKNP